MLWLVFLGVAFLLVLVLFWRVVLALVLLWFLELAIGFLTWRLLKRRSLPGGK